jgi:hypothetical protein
MTATPVALSASSIPRKSERIAARAVDGKALLVVVDAGKLHTLNVVGSRVFELCDGTRNVSAIAEQIATEFAVDTGRAERDALAFLSTLIAEGAVELSDGAAR